MEVRIFLVLNLVAAVRGLLVAGCETKKIVPDPSLPYILEADLLASSNIQHHDPLSSCYWPAAVPLARLVSDLVVSPGERHLELGCGTGLCSLAAAARGAKAIATDVSDMALALTAAAAAAQGLPVETQRFDAMSFETPLPEADVLILSDLFVTDTLARAHARRVVEACEAGFKRVCVVDPGRTTRATFHASLDQLGCTPALHGGFASADVVRERAAVTNRPEHAPLLLLLDTAVGRPVDYAI